MDTLVETMGAHLFCSVMITIRFYLKVVCQLFTLINICSTIAIYLSLSLINIFDSNIKLNSHGKDIIKCSMVLDKVHKRKELKKEPVFCGEWCFWKHNISVYVEFLNETDCNTNNKMVTKEHIQQITMTWQITILDRLQRYIDRSID